MGIRDWASLLIMSIKRLDRCREAYRCEYCYGDGLYHGSPNYLAIDMVYNFCKHCNGTGFDLALGLFGYQHNDPGLIKNIVRSTEPMWRTNDRIRS